jgi:hypothetical protein
MVSSYPKLSYASQSIESLVDKFSNHKAWHGLGIYCLESINLDMALIPQHPFL